MVVPINRNHLYIISTNAKKQNAATLETLDSYQWLRLAVPDLIEAMHKSSQIPRPNAVVELSFEQRTPWRCWWPVNGRWNAQKNWSQQRRANSKSENLFGISMTGSWITVDWYWDPKVCLGSSFLLDSHVLLFSFSSFLYMQFVQF